MALGIYISVPFCRSKCSFCNFASGVFSRDRLQRYVDRILADIAASPRLAEGVGADLDRDVDTLYLGGGTPSTLAPEQLEQLVRAVRGHFQVTPQAEVTVECAPGTLSPQLLDAFRRCGVTRISLGVQSFVDAEVRSVGRLHDRATTLADLDRLRAAGFEDINLDLIAGLPHQTEASWQDSLRKLLATGVPHASVYLLEVDEDSRLGRELIAGGRRYHAHHVPEADRAADFYESACALLPAQGLAQYEISNFARPGCESRHNLKYWTRQPYLGFGLDAHSMLPVASPPSPAPDAPVAVRFSTTHDLDAYLAQSGPVVDSLCVTRRQSLEEQMFLGLRLNRGVDLARVRQDAQAPLPPALFAAVRDASAAGLLAVEQERVRLTPRGRLLSNEVFARFLGL
jgi:oxygen-independent coproporphyrinogen-3 oxidase